MSHVPVQWVQKHRSPCSKENKKQKQNTRDPWVLVLRGHVPSGWGSWELSSHPNTSTLPAGTLLHHCKCKNTNCWFFFFLGSVDEKTPYLALGAVKNISLNISISNLGDDAYDANVSFNVSRELFFINMWQKVRRAPLKGRHLPSNTRADLLCSMGHAMILQRPLLYKELGITRNRLSSWTRQAAGMAQVSAMNTYPREHLSYVVLRPFSLVDWPSLSSYSCYFQHIYIL